MDDPPLHDLASFVTSKTSVAKSEQTLEDYEKTFCGQMHIGLYLLKEVDILDDDKTTLTEQKFFEMECQVLDLGLDKNQK